MADRLRQNNCGRWTAPGRRMRRLLADESAVLLNFPALTLGAGVCLLLLVSSRTAAPLWQQTIAAAGVMGEGSGQVQTNSGDSTVSGDSKAAGEPRFSAGQAAAGDDNPLLRPSPLPFQAPDFRLIRNEHYVPAFEAGMRQQLEQIEAIAHNPEPPTFENTLTAMERSGEVLRRVTATFFHMSAAHTSDEIQAIQTQMAPRLAAHADNIHLHPQLFARIRCLFEQREQLSLTEEQRKLLKDQYEDFVRAGALLTAPQQARLRAINEELSALTTRFQDNLLALTKERAVVVDDAGQLAGLDPADLAAAAQAANEAGHAGKYLLAITNTTRQPVLTSLRNRELRQRVWEASAYRGLGHGGGLDNRPLVLQLARLRAERAALLGYPHHAAWQLQKQMAHEPAAALQMLTDLIPALLQKTQQEADEIRALLRQDLPDVELMPWDWEYYAELVRRAKYAVDEAAVRPWFELNQVLENGVFFCMRQQFGIEFRERSDLPVYHSDVRVFDVLEADGTPLGLFYADYIHRDSKRGGAWMSSFVDQSRLLQEQPVIINVMNIPRPAAGEPALISFDHVSTLFHEMGHAVHGLFSSVTYPTLSGTAVPRDFVEFPSTFQEDWAIQPEVLSHYARHHSTGARIPQDLLNRLIQARRFNQGFETLEYVAAAVLDLAWHTLTADQIPVDVEAFEAAVLQQAGLDLPAVPPRYRSCYFAHIWSGGYAASYYAYLWSEVLAADAFAYMLASGGLTRQNGTLFRDRILSRGGSREPLPMYLEFRGQPPHVDALLRRRGLSPAAADAAAQQASGRDDYSGSADSSGGTGRSGP